MTLDMASFRSTGYCDAGISKIVLFLIIILRNDQASLLLRTHLGESSDQ